MTDTAPIPSDFNPMEHMSKVSGQQYLEVKWRLVWLRAKHPDARIETELLHYHYEPVPKKGASTDKVRAHAVVRAVVELPDGSKASGIGSESMNDFDDFLEKAETKAVGRAVAMLGFGTQFAQEGEFDLGGAVVDTPVAPTNARVAVVRNNQTVASTAADEGLTQVGTPEPGTAGGGRVRTGRAPRVPQPPDQGQGQGRVPVRRVVNSQNFGEEVNGSDEEPG